MESVRAGLFIGAEASFESMKHCFLGIKIGPPDVNFAVSELEHLRVGSPGVRVGHRVILFDSMDQREDLGNPSQALPLAGNGCRASRMT
jgi:hypothetical protein